MLFFFVISILTVILNESRSIFNIFISVLMLRHCYGKCSVQVCVHMIASSILSSRRVALKSPIAGKFKSTQYHDIGLPRPRKLTRTERYKIVAVKIRVASPLDVSEQSDCIYKNVVLLPKTCCRYLKMKESRFKMECIRDIFKLRFIRFKLGDKNVNIA